jgi:hypothetical protein
MLAGSGERINKAWQERQSIGQGRRSCMRQSNNEAEVESRLETLYSGASEACARSVFMFVCSDDAESESGSEFLAASN